MVSNLLQQIAIAATEPIEKFSLRELISDHGSRSCLIGGQLDRSTQYLIQQIAIEHRRWQILAYCCGTGCPV
jgi:hypothetical protein